MRLHKAGRGPITFFALLWIGASLALILLCAPLWLSIPLIVGLSVLFGLILNFFRNPVREGEIDHSWVMCPADGKVVVIEETDEPELLCDRRIQLSIFMSPLNVHVNRFPVAGTVDYVKYHPGKFLVAWHPKSSTLNERNTVAVTTTGGHRILFRQIAGAVARRIKCYTSEGVKAEQGGEFGFISFGSRVDVFLPLGSEILVEKDQVVWGGVDALAKLP